VFQRFLHQVYIEYPSSRPGTMSSSNFRNSCTTSS
jgi:hypothetical protein